MVFCLIFFNICLFQNFYQHVFNGCYAVLFFIVVVFFLIYGVEVYFKVSCPNIKCIIYRQTNVSNIQCMAKAGLKSAVAHYAAKCPHSRICQAGQF